MQLQSPKPVPAARGDQVSEVSEGQVSEVSEGTAASRCGARALLPESLPRAAASRGTGRVLSPLLSTLAAPST